MMRTIFVMRSFERLLDFSLSCFAGSRRGGLQEMSIRGCGDQTGVMTLPSVTRRLIRGDNRILWNRQAIWNNPPMARHERLTL